MLLIYVDLGRRSQWYHNRYLLGWDVISSRVSCCATVHRCNFGCLRPKSTTTIFHYLLHHWYNNVLRRSRFQTFLEWQVGSRVWWRWVLGVGSSHHHRHYSSATTPGISIPHIARMGVGNNYWTINRWFVCPRFDLEMVLLYQFSFLLYLAYYERHFYPN